MATRPGGTGCLSIAFALGVSAAVGGCRAGGGPGGGAPAEIGGVDRPRGATAQDFQLDDVDGRRFQLSDHRGKSVVVLDFWATWCDPCKVELPRLIEIHEKYAARGLMMVGISVDGPESIAQVRGDVRQMRIPFPVLLDQESRVVAMYNPRRSAPYTVVIDRGGRIIHQHEGYTPGDEVGLAREIELALGE